MSKKSFTKLLAKNKKAYFDYEVLEKFTAGIILTGPEVKSIKGGHVQLKGSYATVQKGHVIAEKIHVSPYPYSAQKNYEPFRRRELLLKHKEIDFLAGQSAEKGLTLVPLEILQQGTLIKVILGVCRGKKAHDKRATLKGRAVTRDIAADLKRFTKNRR